jgi:autotransporter-associated beta strand protein
MIEWESLEFEPKPERKRSYGKHLIGTSPLRHGAEGLCRWVEPHRRGGLCSRGSVVTAKRLLIDSYSQPLKKKRRKLPTRETRFFLFQAIATLLTVQRLYAQTVNVTVGTDGTAPAPANSYRAAVQAVNDETANTISVDVSSVDLVTDINPIMKPCTIQGGGSLRTVQGGGSTGKDYQSFILSMADSTDTCLINNMKYIGRTAGITSATAVFSATSAASVLDANSMYLGSGALHLGQNAGMNLTGRLEMQDGTLRLDTGFADGAFALGEIFTSGPRNSKLEVIPELTISSSMVPTWTLDKAMTFIAPASGSGLVIDGLITGEGGLVLQSGVMEISDRIEGAGSVTVQSGMLTLNGGPLQVVYSGGTTIKAGELALTETAEGISLGFGDVTIYGGATVSTSASGFTGQQQIVNPWHLAGTAGAATFDINGRDTLLFGVIDGANGVGIRKKGASALSLIANNTFTGAVTVEEGTLRLTSPQGLGLTANPVSLFAGTTLDTFGSSIPNPITFAGSGTPPQVQVSGVSTTTMSGALSGGGFGKTGNGTLILTSPQSSYTGNITVAAGKMFLGFSGGTLGSGASQTLTILPNGCIGATAGSSAAIASTVVLASTTDTSITVELASNASLTLLAPVAESVAFSNLYARGATGAEVLNLTGGGSYTGSTQAQNCTLAVSNLASSFVGLLGSRGTLRGIGNASVNELRLLTTSQPTLDSGADSLTLNGAISGSLGFKKQGAGTLSVNGLTNPLTGPVEVNGGTLSVGGVLGAGSPVTALTGTTVTGGGQVQSLTTAGTLAASDYAALTIADDLTLAASSTTLTNLTTTAVSTFVVGGVAHLDGALVTSVNTLEPFVAGSQYNLVVGTRDGVFSSFSLVGIGAPNEPPAPPIIRSKCCTYDACCEKNCGQQAPAARGSSMPKLQLVYEANRVYLEVIGGSFPGGRPLCCPAAGVYDYLSSVEAAEGSDLMNVFNALGKLRECVFDDALVLLSPANWDGMVQTAEELLMLNQTMMSDRVGLIAHTPCADLEPGAKGWVGVVGGATTRGAAESLSGWQAGLVQTGLGADYSTSSGRIGVAFSYGSDHTMWKDVDNSAKWETVGGNLYGSWTGEHVYVFGTAYGAAATAKGTRAICFPGVQRWAYNDHSGAAFALRAGLGYMARWERVSVIPYLEGDLSSIHESDWYETGAQSLNLWVDRRTVNFGRATVGIAVAGCRGDRDSGMEALLGLGFTLQTPFHDPCLVSHLGCQCDVDCLALSGNNRTQRWFAPVLALKWHGSSRWDFVLQANATLSDSIKTGSGLAQLVYRF